MGGGAVRPVESRAGKRTWDSMCLHCSPFNRQMFTEQPLRNREPKPDRTLSLPSRDWPASVVDKSEESKHINFFVVVVV